MKLISNELLVLNMVCCGINVTKFKGSTKRGSVLFDESQLNAFSFVDRLLFHYKYNYNLEHRLGLVEIFLHVDIQNIKKNSIRSNCYCLKILTRVRHKVNSAVLKGVTFKKSILQF